jgi:hypothetical protein
VLEDLTEIAAEKGTHLYSVSVRRGRLEGAEVRESPDRYANADTSYLLQLLEEYNGIVLSKEGRSMGALERERLARDA